MSEWMAGVGNHLWQTTAFVGVAWGLTLLLRKNQARVRYGLWVAASVKFLLPFSLLIALGGMLPRPQRMVAAPAVYSTMDEVALPFDGALLPVNSVALTHVSEARHGAPGFVVALGVVWGCGVVMVLAVWASRWRRVWKTLRRAEMVEQGREFDLLQQVQRAMGGRARVSLRLSRELMEPGIFGILRPVLIWPQRLSDRLDDEHIEAILIHELAHVRRRDNLTAAVHMLVEALFWFHPAVWWMERRLVEERERACDEAVVAMGSKPGVYADSLLKAVRFCVESPLTCVAGITGADLSKRVRGIMTLRLERLGVGRTIALAAFGVAVVGVPILLGQAKPAQRMLLTAVDAAPKPFRAAAHAMMPLEETPVAGEIAEAQVSGGVDATLAQAEAKPFAFEVVSIRPSKPGNNRRSAWSMHLTDDGLQIANMPLSGMLASAYRRQLQSVDGRILGLPDWAKNEAFDVQAKVADSDIAAWSKVSHSARRPDEDRVDLSLLLLVTDQFKLKTHSENRNEQRYALVVARGGPKLKLSAADGPKAIQMLGPGHLSYTGASIDDVVDMCAQMLGRKVVDRTGLTGKYDYTLDWTAYEGPAAATGSETDAAQPPVFTVMQEELGLKLEAEKGPVEYIVVDQAEKPGPMDGAEVPAGAGVAVAAVQSPEFAVSTVKPSQAATSDKSGIYTGHGRLDGQNVTLLRAIIGAYAVGPHQVVGGPDWVDTARWDMQAKADQDINDDRTLNAMQAALLTDRFKLAMHKETRMLPAYVLEVAKGGPKLEKAKGGDSETDTNTTSGSRNRVTITIKNTDMELFAAVLSRKMDLPVVNQTGLEGIFNFKLHWTPDDAKASDDPDAVSIFTAIEEQLGLKLRAAKAPVEVLVIDHAEMPAAN